MALFVLSLCPFDISVGIGAFVIGLGQISSFLSFILIHIPFNTSCIFTHERIYMYMLVLVLCHFVFYWDKYIMSRLDVSAL